MRLVQQLRDQDRRKDEFLATLAHELRNPLAPIHNSLQILKMPRVDAATVERSREMMERQLQHLVRLVDDLLDVSARDAGQDYPTFGASNWPASLPAQSKPCSR